MTEGQRPDVSAGDVEHPLSTSVKYVIAECGTQDTDRKPTVAGKLYIILNINECYKLLRESIVI